jgi:predicted MPP superfamily phosphohydrolase
VRWIRNGALIAVVALLAVAGAGIAESWQIRLESVEVVRPDVPPAADGFSLLQISDLHARPGLAREREVAARLAHLDAAALLITGDFRQARGDPAVAIEGAVAATASVKGRMPIYAVVGNNDTPEVGQGLARRGIRMLDNEAVPVAPSIWLAGWNPFVAKHPPLGEVLAPVPPGDFLVLMAHSPDVVLQPGAERAGLVVAGHVHGGQIRLPGLRPFLSLTTIGPAFYRGLYRWGDTSLYVNRGIGTSIVPVRMYAPPEVAQLTLRRGAAPDSR